jgi:hypothetical protein
MHHSSYSNVFTSTPMPANTIRYILASIAWLLIGTPAQAEDPIYFRFRQLFTERSIKNILDPKVNIYLSGDTKPTMLESATPEPYYGMSLQPGWIGGSRSNCVEAFEVALTSMLKEAVTGGFDSILDLRIMEDDVPSSDPEGFKCKPAYKVTSLSLHATFGSTAEAVRRNAEEDKKLLQLPNRPPWEDSIYVPLEPVHDLLSKSARKAR